MKVLTNIFVLETAKSMWVGGWCRWPWVEAVGFGSWASGLPHGLWVMDAKATGPVTLHVAVAVNFLQTDHDAIIDYTIFI